MSEKNNFPKRYNFSEIEKKWIEYWKKENIYEFDLNKEGQIFTIDTPPDFTSGDLHMGHILNHSWIDFVARFRRMQGINVYFPQGYDCHGLPTELAVAEEFKIDKYDRENFLKKCIEWTEHCIKRMTRQFDELGYSTDWNYVYRTMDNMYKKQVQESLLDYYEKGWLYRAKHPTHYCMNCQTSVAKAEVGYMDEEAKIWEVELPLANYPEEYIIIATTRPEYIEACVGIFVHPNDERHYDLIGTQIRIPFSERIVRVEADKDVDMNFGTGIVYLCTFGDEMDIRLQMRYNLPVVQIFTKDGHMNENSKFQGLTILKAREKILEELDKMGLLVSEKEYQHRIIVHTERSSCKQPIEYLPIPQWFIKVKDFTRDIIESGEKMKWFPEKHKRRLIDWCESLDWDWVVSRQRVFGTPIPFWYCNDCGEIFSAKREDLPVDPAREESPVKECTKCKSKDIIGEKDILDCWIDSSITPLVISKWKIDNDFFNKTYIKAIVHRPQGYEIIRTWLFYTLFRCKKLTGKDPFDEVMINGMVAGPDGRKMSKSFGNVVSPDEVLPLYGADALRQWAAMGSLGDDYPFEYSWIEKNTKQPVSKDKIDEEKNKLSEDKFNRKYERRYNQLIGASKFLTKIWNAYRFLYLANKRIDLKEIDIEINELSAIDSYFYKEFNKVLEYITNSFEGYNWHEGFAAFRTFFWYEICDDYIEAIKYKFYLKDEAIKQNALEAVLNLMHKILKILAIISPFISEDIHSILFKNYIKQKSIHLEKWPVPYKGISEKLAEQGKFGIEIIKNVRMVKSSNKIPLNQELNKVILILDINKAKMLEALQIDIKKTIRIKELIVIDKETQRSLTTPDIEEKIEDLDLNILIYK